MHISRIRENNNYFKQELRLNMKAKKPDSLYIIIILMTEKIRALIHQLF